ncbi:leucine-rich repeat domain-containing protein [Prevotella pallens]|jgi:hypothetical protein|uniref:leucine-rich repeat domain-containing protein n=1 Tax=Prevotella pallens TaxID=60133 RepID=UPI0024923696|nr:leucine-rich repeat domain-containing protein [Prevotella pallens]
MKRVLLFLLLCLFVVGIKAQTQNYDFTADYNGVTIYLKITDAAKHYVEFEAKEPGYRTPGYAQLTTIPTKVTDAATGIEYEVKSIGDRALLADTYGGPSPSDFYVPEGIETFDYNILLFAAQKRLHLPTTLKNISRQSEWFGESIIGLENTQIEEIPKGCFNQNYSLKQDWVFPKTLKKIGEGALIYDAADVDITFPPLLSEIDIHPFDYTSSAPKYKKVILLNPTPATITRGTYFSGATMADLLGTEVQTVTVPIDATNAYETNTDWSYYAGKYREEIPVGSTGYRTFYLQNENFVVPTGCTAYVITGTTPSGNIANPDQANVVAYAAGKIIPKQTGFILKGTPSSTIVYRANETGTEETISTNMLVGTATEQEFSGTGYKYYVLANGDQGLGFYKQGSRNGASMKIGAHQAGLRLPESIARGAKSFIVDFDGATEATEAAGISTVAPNAKPNADVIYDLQGRRVVNPTHGIYIINGKKVIK